MKRERKTLTKLDVVKQYLQHGTYPKTYSQEARRTVRRRSKSFLVKDGQMFHVDARTRDLARSCTGVDGTKNKEDQQSQLRKCCLTEEEKKHAVMHCHVREGGKSFTPVFSVCRDTLAPQLFCNPCQ
jgi:hypothetical protein